MPVRFLFLILFTGLLPGLLAEQTSKRCYQQDPDAGARNHKLDYLIMQLDLSFKPREGQVNGTVSYRFHALRNRVDSFFLDGPGIAFQEVKLDEKAVAYHTREEGIWITPKASLRQPDTHQLRISYSAKPRKGLYFVGWDAQDSGSRKQIWSQGQGKGNRHWVPCYDNPNDKLITDVTVTFDAAYQVLSNGAQLDVTAQQSQSTKTWHYRTRQPHSTYLLMLAIGRYKVDKRTAKGQVPLHLYYYPDQPGKLTPTYRHSRAIMDFLQAEIGIPYPWSRYAQVPVQDFLYGAMENTTATVFGDFYYGNKRQQLDQSYRYVNAHELAHHWFGNYITLNSSEHIWLHESFATYYGRLAEGQLRSEAYYQAVREQQLQRALSAAAQSTRPLQHTKAGADRIYAKGALIVGMLRDVVGEEDFQRVVEHFLRQHAYGHVTTHDFQMAFQEVLGLNLDWFFEQWIRHGGLPHYKVDYQLINQTRVEVHIQQIQQTNELRGYYRMPIPIKVYYNDGTHTTAKPMVASATTTVSLRKPKAKTVAYVIFDPKNRVVKRETFPQPLSELVAKATAAPAMIDRYDALKKLRDQPDGAKHKALQRIYDQATSPLVKKEALAQLTEYPPEKVMPQLIKGLSDAHHEVRRAVLQNLESLPPRLEPLYERSLHDSSFRNVELALEHLVRHKPENLNSYLTTTEGIKGLNNHNVRITWLELAAIHKRPSYQEALVAYASPGHEFRTRVKAMRALKRLNHCNRTVIQYLSDAYLNPNSRLSNPARSVLQYFYKQHQYQVMIEQYHDQQKWPAYARKQWEAFLND